MGNSSSSIKKAQYLEQGFVESYIFLKKTKDPTYGKVTILQDKTTKELAALKELFLKSTNEFYREIEAFKQRCKVSHPNVVRLLSYTSKIEDNLCASFYRILLIIDYLDQDFEHEINTKKAKSEYFKEEHLWYLLKSVLSALEFLQQNGVAHGDLKPSNILISRLGSYKIAELALFGSTLSSYMQQLSGFDDVRAYLSPALVQSLSKQEITPQHDTYKSDVFSLGLSVLHAATLTDCDQFHNWKNCRFDVEALQKRINTLKGLYSVQFQDFIESMLTLDEARRPSAAYLLGHLTGLQQQLIATQVESNQTALPEKNQQESTQKSQVGGSNKKSKGSAKKPPIVGKIPQYISSTNSEEFVLKAEPVSKQLHVRMCGSAISGKDDIEASILCPAEDLDNSTVLNLDHESLVLWSGKSSLEQRNTLQNTCKKEPDALSKFQPFQLGLQKQLQQNFQAKLQPNQTQNTSFESNFQLINASYRPPEEVSRILDEYRVKGVLQASKLDENSTLKSGFGLNSDTIKSQAGAVSTHALLSDKNSVKHGQSLGEITLYHALYHSASLLTGDKTLQLSDLQRQRKNSFDFSNHLPTYKPSAEVEKILQEVKNRSLKPTNSVGTRAPSIDVSSKATSSLMQSTRSDNNLEGAKFARAYQQGNVTKTTDNSLMHEKLLRELQKDLREITNSHPQGTNMASKLDYTDSYYDKISQASKFELETEGLGAKRGVNNAKPSFLTGNYLGENQSVISQSNQKAKHSQKGNSYINSDKENYNEMIEDLPYSGAFKTKPEKQGNLTHHNQINTQQHCTNYPADIAIGNPLQPLSLNHFEHRRQLSTSRNTPYRQIEFVREHYADGSAYEGEKVGGLRHGKGKFYYSDGGLYEGEWKAGSMDGFGTLSYPGGQIAYNGEWKEDKFHGKGTVYNENPVPINGDFDYANFDSLGDYWIKYEGEFNEDNKEGFGMLYLSNGDRYEGQFKEDTVHGSGTYVFINNETFFGEWWHNRLA